ncbi:speckle-type POZ protein B [Caerostris darwini]|uniref:Speckle-type POZ protein B n=1 Tax=Caerostris darwini TaxID=1538125 RepID=A0AAV4VUN5_9ARAC|nr:speckle-type POZ protein B [Caerostris darwini]
MFRKVDDRKSGCATIEWKIENFSFCVFNIGKIIRSPSFFLDTLENTRWGISILPTGYAGRIYFKYQFYRDSYVQEPETIEIKSDSSILDANGVILEKSQLTTNKFNKKDNRSLIFDESVVILSKEEESNLPQDALTIQFRLWRTDGKYVENRRIFARTVIQVDRRTFAWAINKFSSLKYHHKVPYVIKSESEEPLMRLELYLSTGQKTDEKITIAHVYSKKVNFFTLKIFLMDAKGDKIECGNGNFWFHNNTEKVTFTLFFTKKTLIDNKSLYLPKDILTLICEYEFSNAIAYEGIERIDCGTIFAEADDETGELVLFYDKRASFGHAEPLTF